MTAKSNGRRGRRGRRSDDSLIPQSIVAWFDGSGPEPWENLVPFEEAAVRRWWKQWCTDRPNVTPPPDAEPAIGLLAGGRSTFGAKNRDGLRAQSAVKETDAGSGEFPLAKKTPKNDAKNRGDSERR